jgi:hypothetical protein
MLIAAHGSRGPEPTSPIAKPELADAFALLFDVEELARYMLLNEDDVRAQAAKNHSD